MSGAAVAGRRLRWACGPHRRRPRDDGLRVILSIAGHISLAMFSRHSHVRMEAKRHALDEIAARQRAADERRKAEAERRQQHNAIITGPIAVS